MSSSEHISDAVTGPPSTDKHAVAEFVDAGPMSPSTPEDSRPTSAARTLELAALRAEQLLTDASVEAASLVSAARATADETAATSRKEVAEVEAQLARTKAGLEAEIASLHQMGTDQRSEMRRILTEQLASLDSTRFEPPAVAPKNLGE
jgi:cell division septum initiation protein DivIVA